MEQQGNWHLARRVSVGHLLTTFSICIGVVTLAMGLENRIARMEEQTGRQLRVDVRQDEAVQRLRKEIRSELQNLNLKIDRHFEHLLEVVR